MSASYVRLEKDEAEMWVTAYFSWETGPRKENLAWFNLELQKHRQFHRQLAVELTVRKSCWPRCLRQKLPLHRQTRREPGWTQLCYPKTELLEPSRKSQKKPARWTPKSNFIDRGGRIASDATISEGAYLDSATFFAMTEILR